MQSLRVAGVTPFGVKVSTTGRWRPEGGFFPVGEVKVSPEFAF